MALTLYFPFTGCYCWPICVLEEPDGVSVVYFRKHFEHSIIKPRGNPLLPLCLLASNHINMKWGCFWVLTQCHSSKHSHKHFQDVCLNQMGGGGKTRACWKRIFSFCNHFLNSSGILQSTYKGFCIRRTIFHVNKHIPLLFSAMFNNSHFLRWKKSPCVLFV